MGIYSGKTNMFGGQMMNIEPAVGYDDGAISAQVVMIENYQNQLKVFDGTILNDIQEATMRIDGVSESEILSFSESAIGDLLSKIKEMFKKLWAKIKAIFQGFMARLTAKFGSNNKKFVEKYRKVLLTKDLTDFEPKHRPRTSNDIPTFDGVPSHLGNIHAFNPKELGKDADSLNDKWDEDKKLDDLVKAINTKFTDWKSFEKDFMDYCYDEEEEKKVSITGIMGELVAFKDLRKDWQKANDSLNKAMDKLIKLIDKDTSEFSKNFPKGKGTYNAKTYDFGKETGNSGSGKDARWENKGGTDTGNQISTDGQDNTSDTGDAAKYQKGLGLTSKYAHLTQQVATKYTQCVMKVLTFGNKQNRAILAKAVAYSKKSNESVMMEAMAELAEWEMDY